MPGARPLSRKEFLALMEIEATKLERFARQLREGKWGSFNIEESVSPRNRRDLGQEKVTIIIRASRTQAYGTGLDISLDEEDPTR